MRRSLAMLALVLSLAGPALPTAAEEGCWYSDQLYPHGTRIGGMVCDNGEWVEG
jgi:hypothetical protein